MKILFCGFGRSGKMTRYAYQLEIQAPGTTVRLVDCKGKIVKENTL